MAEINMTVEVKGIWQVWIVCFSSYFIGRKYNSRFTHWAAEKFVRYRINSGPWAPFSVAVADYKKLMREVA